jgi:hypothetical protein
VGHTRNASSNAKAFEDGERQRFTDLANTLGAQLASSNEPNVHVVGASRTTNHTFELHLKLLLGNEYSVLQLWATPADDNYQGAWAEAQAVVATILIPRGEHFLFDAEAYLCSNPIPGSMIEIGRAHV